MTLADHLSGLEGLVSKRRDRPYQGAVIVPIKVKNRQHSGMGRVMETFG